MCELIHRNHYYLYGDSASLFDGYACLCPPGEESPMLPSGDEIHCLYEALICEFYMDRNRPDSAEHYFAKSYAKREALENFDFKETVYGIYTKYYDRKGKPGRSLEMMKIRDACSDSIIAYQQPQRKIYLENIRTLEEFEARQEAESRRRWWLITSICIILAGIIGAVTLRVMRWRRHQIARRHRLKAYADEKERRILAMALKEQETKKVINYVQERTQELGREQKVTTGDLSVIERNLRMHMATQSALESFERVFADIKPEFINHLRETAPGLSENNIRLCCYLALGLNNREISNIQNVSPDSLRQARRRLKLKFGLTRDDSLEDYLRNIYNNTY